VSEHDSKAPDAGNQDQELLRSAAERAIALHACAARTLQRHADSDGATKLEVLDGIDVEEIPAGEVLAVFAILVSPRSMDWPTLGALWLFWRSLERSDVPAEVRNALAGDLAVLIGAMQDPSMAPRRLALFETALAQVPAWLSPGELAHWYYALARTLLSMRDATVPNRLEAAIEATARACTLARMAGDRRRAAESLALNVRIRGILVRSVEASLAELEAELRGLLADDAVQKDSYLCALLRHELAILLFVRPHLDAARCDEIRSLLEQAHAALMAPDGNAKQAAMVEQTLAGLEQHALALGISDRSDAVWTRLQNAMQSFSQTPGEQLGQIIHQMARHAGVHNRYIGEARDFLERLFAQAPPLPNDLHASLLAWRAWLEMVSDDASRTLEDRHVAARRHLDRAWRLVANGRAEYILEIADRAVRVHRLLGGLELALDAIAQARELLGARPSAEDEAHLLASEHDVLLERDQEQDAAAAVRVLDRLLDLAESHAVVRAMAAGVAFAWARRACHRGEVAENHARGARIRGLAQEMPTGMREDLALLLDAIDGRTRGQSAIEHAARALLDRAAGADAAGALPWSSTAWQFARENLGEIHELTQGAARMAEPHALACTTRTATLGHVAQLLDLALLRLLAPPQDVPRREHGEDASRLVEHALALCHVVRVSEVVQEHARGIQRWAQIRILGTTPGLDGAAFLAQARTLAEECLRARDPHAWLALRELCLWLHRYPCIDAQPLRALADELARAAEIDDVADIQRRRALLLDRLGSQASGDPVGALMARSRSCQVRPGLAGDVIREAENLLESAAGHDRARVLHALGLAWAAHPAHASIATLSRALEHLERARELWPVDDVEGHLGLLLDYTEVLRVLALTKREGAPLDTARALLRHCLESRDGHASPRWRTQLLFRLGVLEMNGRMSGAVEQGALESARATLLQALQECPAGESELQGSILISLGNTERYLAKEARDTAMMDSAIIRYREALALIGERDPVLDLEGARCRKCLADALLARTRLGDQVTPQHLLDDAMRLLERALETRSAEHSSLTRAETLASVTQVCLALHEHGREEALVHGYAAIREALVLCTPSLDPTTHARLVELRYRVERRLQQAGHTPDPAERISPREASRAVEFLYGLPAPTKFAPYLSPNVSPIDIDEVAGDVFSQRMRACLEAFPWRDMDSAVEETCRHIDDAVRPGLERELGSMQVEHLCAMLMNARSFQSLPRTRQARVLSTARQLFESTHWPALPWDLKVLLQLFYGIAATASPDRDPAAIDWEGAESALRKVVATLREHRDQGQMLCDALAQLARILYHRPGHGQRQRWEEARRLSIEALAAADRDGSIDTKLMLLQNLGTLVSRMADEDPSLRPEAIRFYDEIFVLSKNNGLAPEAEVIARSSRAWVRLQLDLEGAQPRAAHEALKDLQRAIAILDTHPGLEQHRGKLLNHLGVACATIYRHGREGRYRDEAYDAYDGGMKYYEAEQDPQGWARVAHNLGLLCINDGAREEGMQWLMRTLGPRLSDADYAWETLSELGQNFLYAWSEDAKPAARIVVASLNDVARRLDTQGRAVRALEAMMLALSVHARVDGRVDVAALDACIATAERYWREAVSSESRLHLARFLADLCARRTWEAACRGEPPLEILAHASRGKARTLLLDRNARSLMLEPRMFQKRSALARDAAAARASSEPAARVRVLDLDAEARRLDQEIASAARPMLAVDHEALLRALATRPGTAFIEIALSSGGTVAVVVRLESSKPEHAGQLCMEVRTLSLSLYEVVAWLRRPDHRGWLDALGSLSAGPDALLEWAELSHACMMPVLENLHARLIAPVVHGLAEAGIEHLVFAIHGPLAALPLVAACQQTERGPRYLIEDFTSVRIVPSAEVFVWNGAPGSTTGGTAMIVACDPKGSLKGLDEFVDSLDIQLEKSGVRTEIYGSAGKEKINERAHPATRTNVLAALNESELAHFLVHGRFDPLHLDRSGLALDGAEFLSCKDLLETTHAIRAKLILIGACQSAETRMDDLGAEWLGVSGAFLRVGARAVIGALWSILYSKTANIYRFLYQELARGRDIHVALAQAMRAELERGRRVEHDSGSEDVVLWRWNRIAASPLMWAGLQMLSSG
jgi:CHAT domain-containing protein/tetratricopeptide (TPR) repeat protein